jgi:hypothetical protein
MNRFYDGVMREIMTASGVKSMTTQRKPEGIKSNFGDGLQKEYT